MDERQAYVEKMDAQLKQWKAKADKLRAQAQESTADVKLQYARQLAELETKIDAAIDVLNKLRNDQTAPWAELKAGFEQAFNTVKDAADRAFQKSSM
jgi:uncharacterized phage infection (PIP) family protein YhgE